MCPMCQYIFPYLRLLDSLLDSYLPLLDALTCAYLTPYLPYLTPLLAAQMRLLEKWVMGNK